MQKQSGFTLIELMIVVAVIGILAAIGIPRFAAQKDKAYVAEAVNIMSAIRQGQLAYRLEHSTYKNLTTTDNWDVIGMSNPNNSSAKFEYTVTNADADSAIIEAEQTIAGPAQDEAIELDVASGNWSGDHRFRPRN